MLHTWGRDLRTYHPHVHFVVPGGGVSPNGMRWLQVQPDRLFYPLAAMELYKKLFAQAMKQAGLYSKMPYGVLKKNWVVNIKPVGNGEAVLKYLAPYVYRVAISDCRIENVDEKGVTYRVTPSGSKQSVSRRATGQQFVSGFVQHILPSGFQKIRYYGFMSPNCKLKMENVRWLVWLYRGWTYWLGSAMFQPEIKPRRGPVCSDCGGELELEAITDPFGRTIYRREQPARAPP